MPSLQVAWNLFYFCAVPRINHLLRTVAPAQIFNVAAAHDQAILNTFRMLFAVQESVADHTDLHRSNYALW
eukprot:5532952-Karenia_brevis.AAC.1